jgi:hypothetical protein
MRFILGFLACFLTFINAAAQPGMLWNKSYGDPGIRNQDVCFALCITADSGFALAGNTNSIGNGSYDFWLIKTDAMGDTLWTRTYGGTGTDLCYALKQTQDGGFLLAGTSNSFSESFDDWVIRTDSAGDTLWSRTFGGVFDDQCWGLQLTSDGGIIMAGPWNGHLNPPNSDIGLVKIDSIGALQWMRVYDIYQVDVCKAVRQTQDNGYILGGYKWESTYINDIMLLLKTDSAGVVEWNRIYGAGFDYSRCNDLLELPGEEYLLAGEIGHLGPFIGYGAMLWVDSSGDTIRTRTYGPGGLFGGDIISAVAPMQDGGFVAAGFYEGSVQAAGDFWVFKTDILGDMLWSQTFSNDDSTYGLFGEVCTSINVIDDHTFAMAGYKGQGDFISQLDFWLVLASTEVTVTERNSPSLNFAMYPNWPNPFNMTTTLSFYFPQSREGEIVVYDVLGRRVGLLAKKEYPAGQNNVTFDASGLPSGAYFAVLNSGNVAMTCRMMLIK